MKFCFVAFLESNINLGLREHEKNHLTFLLQNSLYLKNVKHLWDFFFFFFFDIFRIKTASFFGNVFWSMLI
jgi:hypothetical protein